MSVASSFVAAVTDGHLLVAAPVAAAAGLVSFLSPCCLPLVPGYLSYVTGASGSSLSDGKPAGRGDEPRQGLVLAGSVLFVAGFSAVFIAGGALFGGVGGVLTVHRRAAEIVLGGLTVLMGLVFVGLLPRAQRDVRFRPPRRAGLWGAPVLGVAFGVGWTPCLGPTLAAVQALAYTQASAGRGALLTSAYCLGLGLPFILTGLMFERALGVFAVVRRHSVAVTRTGGAMMMAVGALLATGLWQHLTVHLQAWTASFGTVL